MAPTLSGVCPGHGIVPHCHLTAAFPLPTCPTPQYPGISPSPCLCHPLEHPKLRDPSWLDEARGTWGAENSPGSHSPPSVTAHSPGRSLGRKIEDLGEKRFFPLSLRQEKGGLPPPPAARTDGSGPEKREKCKNEEQNAKRCRKAGTRIGNRDPARISRRNSRVPRGAGSESGVGDIDVTAAIPERC